MKIAYNSGSEFVLVFEKGEHYLKTFKQFLEEREINSGFFHGLGGFQEFEIAYYDLDAEEYISKNFEDGPYEVANMIGNIANVEDGRMIHNHVVVGNNSYESSAGHLNEAVVGGTLEIHLNVLDSDGELSRELDEKTGLDLLTEK